MLSATLRLFIYSNNKKNTKEKFRNRYRKNKGVCNVYVTPAVYTDM